MKDVFEKIVDSVLAGLKTRNPHGLDRALFLKLLDIVFWTSLETEESRAVRFRLLVPLEANAVDIAMPFNPSNKLEKGYLVKLALAAGLESTSIVIIPTGGELTVAGLAFRRDFRSPLLGFSKISDGLVKYLSIEVRAAGVFAVYIQSELFCMFMKGSTELALANPIFKGMLSQKLTTIATRFVTALQEKLPPHAVEFYLGVESDAYTFKLTLGRLLRYISRLGHGGSLVVAPEFPLHGVVVKNNVTFDGIIKSLLAAQEKHFHMSFVPQDGMKEPIAEKTYVAIAAKTFPTERHLISVSYPYPTNGLLEIDQTCERVAELANVDGVLVLDDVLSVRSFGAEIVSTSTPNLTTGTDLDAMNVGHCDWSLFGNRHKSIFRFCYDNPNAVGFIFSQDGGIKAATRIGEDVAVWLNIESIIDT